MSIKVILLEDDDDFRELVNAMLLSRGYDVVTASEPMHCSVYKELGAVCSAAAACADIILTDYFMPNMTGIEYLERIGACGCKVAAGNKAVMSAALPEHETARLRALGCRFFQKPFSAAELNHWLDECEERITVIRLKTDCL